MRKLIICALAAATAFGAFAAIDAQTLWKSGDRGVTAYRIPALCTAPNGDLIAVCDARKEGYGDLNHAKPINISCRRSTDGGKTWTDPVDTWTWKWTDDEHWAGSDPSLIVDSDTKKIFLFYNVWESKKRHGIFQFYVQESSDNGKTWSEPRDISSDIAFPEWPFGKPVKNGDECKVVELRDGSWMINSRWRGGGRQIHVSKDRGDTWESWYDKSLFDPQCNAQIMRYGKVLLFSNCKADGRRNLYLRASLDDGKTWGEGICIQPQGAAYSDITVLGNGDIGVLYEGAGYNTINYAVVPRADVVAEFKDKE